MKAVVVRVRLFEIEGFCTLPQSKTFLQAFHQARLSQSAKLVEDEQWNPAEVSPAVQRIVDMLVESSIRDPRDLLLNPPPLNPGSPLPPTSPLLSPAFPGDRHRPSSPMPSPAPNRTSVTLNGTRKSTSSPGKYLKIEERNYFAVSATLEVLILLVDYLKLIMNLPMLTTDTMSRVIELMKAFNSRTCQVVLGAGAMRSAGLKNITAKHLGVYCDLRFWFPPVAISNMFPPNPGMWSLDVVLTLGFLYSGVLKMTDYSTGFTVALGDDLPDSIHPGNLSSAFEPETSRYACGV